MLLLLLLKQLETIKHDTKPQGLKYSLLTLSTWYELSMPHPLLCLYRFHSHISTNSQVSKIPLSLFFKGLAGNHSPYNLGKSYEFELFIDWAQTNVKAY